MSPKSGSGGGREGKNYENVENLVKSVEIFIKVR